MPKKQGKKDRPRGPDGRFIKKEPDQANPIELESTKTTPIKTSKDPESLPQSGGSQPQSSVQLQGTNLSTIISIALIRDPMSDNGFQTNEPNTNTHNTNPSTSHSPTTKASRRRRTASLPSTIRAIRAEAFPESVDEPRHQGHGHTSPYGHTPPPAPEPRTYSKDSPLSYNLSTPIPEHRRLFMFEKENYRNRKEQPRVEEQTSEVSHESGEQPNQPLETELRFSPKGKSREEYQQELYSASPPRRNRAQLRRLS